MIKYFLKIFFLYWLFMYLPGNVSSIPVTIFNLGILVFRCQVSNILYFINANYSIKHCCTTPWADTGTSCRRGRASWPWHSSAGGAEVTRVTAGRLGLRPIPRKRIWLWDWSVVLQQRQSQKHLCDRLERVRGQQESPGICKEALTGTKRIKVPV